MSGHSKWSTIKRQKGVNDAKRGAVFTRLGNQIAIAARGGTDPATNSTLALVIEKAKAANMPTTNIQRAIDRVADKNAAQLEEVTYEAYGPGGIAILIEAATDNRNRTFPEVRHALSKSGGTIAEPGSVSFQFSRKGVIRVTYDGDIDTALLSALDCGAEDATEDDGGLSIITDVKSLHAIRQALSVAGLNIVDAEPTYLASTTVDIDDPETARKIVNLMEALDELDDVTAVHSNFDLA